MRMQTRESVVLIGDLATLNSQKFSRGLQVKTFYLLVVLRSRVLTGFDVEDENMVENCVDQDGQQDQSLSPASNFMVFLSQNLQSLSGPLNPLR